jgi:RNA polymerase sigma factor (sigma-70 family)
MNPAVQASSFPCDPLATRPSLIERIRDWSDDESWQQFLQTYWRLIYALAIRHGLTESEAEEVVQATLIAVAKRIGTFKYDPGAGSFRQWLIHQARWRIADLQRKRHRERQLFVPGHSRAASSPTRTATAHRVPDLSQNIETRWEREWHASVHAAALQALRTQLNPKHYQVFDLYVLREWPASRVRRTLGIGLAQMHLINTRVRHLYRRECVRLERALAERPKGNSSPARRS